MRKLAALTIFAAQICHAQGTISTVAGSGSCCSSADGGQATATFIGGPNGVAVDPSGNLYIVYQSSTVRKVNAAGIISTFAGSNAKLSYSGDGGPAAQAGFFTPWGLAADSSGNIYVADQQDHRVRKIDTSGTVTTVAGNGSPGYIGDNVQATKTSLNYPLRVAVDKAGNLYIADQFNLRVRKVDTTGIITTVAGNGNSEDSSNLGDGGQAVNAAIGTVKSVAVDNAGNVYFATAFRLRKVNAAGVISTIAGNGLYGTIGDGGPAVNAQIVADDLATDSAGNVYIADNAGFRVRKVDMSSGIIKAVAGNGTYTDSGDGGLSTSAGIKSPYGVTFDALGNLYIADNGAGKIRKVAAPAAALPTISANGVVDGASFLPGIVPNSWATIQGAGLAAVTDTWANAIVNGNLPTALDGVRVTVGGRPAYVYFVSPGQINFLVPDIAAGPVPVTVTNSVGTSATFTVNAAQYGPAFFSWPGSQVVATRQDFTLAAKNGTFNGATTIAAKPGDVLILWGTGFGPTVPAAPFGVVVPATQTYSTTAPPTVTINNVSATVYGAALAPGFAGLYQVAIQVPPSLADGDWPLVASIGGASSPGAMILSVKH